MTNPNPGRRRPEDEMEKTRSVDEATEAELRKFAATMKDELAQGSDALERAQTFPKFGGSGSRPSNPAARASSMEETATVDEKAEAELRRLAATMKEEFRQGALTKSGAHRAIDELEKTKSIDEATEAELRRFAEELAGKGGKPSGEMEQTKSVDEATEAELRKFAATMKQELRGAPPAAPKKPAPRPPDDLEKTKAVDEAMQRELENFADHFDLGEDDLPSR